MDENNLMENVRTFFTEQYHGMEKSDSFLSFEPLGSMIDPEDFMDGNEEISDIKATEQLSILGDRLPQISDVFFTGTSKFSSVYEVLINSVEFSGSKLNVDDKTSYINMFSTAKADAFLKLEVGKKASIKTPEGEYLPVYGYPKKWYDPESPFWVGKTFSAQENKGPASPKTPVSTLKLMPLVWRAKLSTDLPILDTVQKASGEETPPTSPEMSKIRPTLTMERNSGLNLMTRKTAVPLRSVRSAVMTPNFLSLPHFKKNETTPVEPIKPKTELKDLNILKRFNVADRVKLTGYMVHTDVAPVTPVHSDEFSMSFDYCIVYLERPWFTTSMFHYRDLWYCKAFKEDYFSSGIKDETNDGTLKCIPTAMILIKDLRITAAWTQEDKNNAAQSVGLGIFNVNGSQFINNELVTPGMQIIGWMCEVIPKLPAMSDPNIEFSPETPVKEQEN